MSSPLQSILLLALGNDIIGDDGIGLAAARILREQFQGDVDIEDAAEAGLNLLDIMSGYDRVLILDSIVTGRHPHGTVLEFSRADFDKVVAPSPHYAGLPEVLELAKRLKIEFPREILVLALEIEECYDFRETLSPVIERSLPAFVEKARLILHKWKEENARNISNTKSPGEYSP